METQLEKDLLFLLSLKETTDYIKVDEILKDRKISINSFYKNFYTRPISEKDWKFNNIALKGILNNQKEVEFNWNIRNIKPFYENFSSEKFWFRNSIAEKNPYKDLSTEPGSIVAFREGINSFFYEGEYLNGGDIYSEETKPIPNNPRYPEKKVDDENYYRNYIYAYFPPKLHLSQNSKSYYILIQGKHLLRNREQPVIRFYFNLKPKPEMVNDRSLELYQKSVEEFRDKVNDFVNEIELFLNKRRIPFQFKMPISLENFRRADTFVLYVAQKHYYYLHDFIKELYLKYYDSIIGNEEPLFTERFEGLKGISIAEDPGVLGDSFGSSRCELIYDIIEELARDNAQRNTMTVNDIVLQLGIRGYLNGFFRNPLTKYNYEFRSLETTINLSNSYPKETKFYLYVYGRIALNYALDLIERAVWLSPTEFTWLTYYQSEDEKEKYYRVVDEGEEKKIFLFLRKILYFPWMRVDFPENVQKIIMFNSNNNDSSNPIQPIVDDLIKDNEYKQIIENIKDFDTLAKQVPNFVLTYFKNRKFDNFQKETEEYWKTIFSIPNDETVEDMYGIAKIENTPEVIKNARKIYYQYIKPLYPIKNQYGNYEYVPTDRGKLKIGMMMLFIYCRSIFNENAAPQVRVSSPKSPSQKWWMKLPFLH